MSLSLHGSTTNPASKASLLQKKYGKANCKFPSHKSLLKRPSATSEQWLHPSTKSHHSSITWRPEDKKIPRPRANDTFALPRRPWQGGKGQVTLVVINILSPRSIVEETKEEANPRSKWLRHKENPISAGKLPPRLLVWIALLPSSVNPRLDPQLCTMPLFHFALDLEILNPL